MNEDGYAYRLRITRNYDAPEVRFHVLISAVPIHVNARLNNSVMPHSAVHEGDRLLVLLTEALGDRSLAANELNEAMSGQSVELNLGHFASDESRRKLGKSGS